jgi:hypothetical protein
LGSDLRVFRSEQADDLAAREATPSDILRRNPGDPTDSVNVLRYVDGTVRTYPVGQVDRRCEPYETTSSATDLLRTLGRFDGTRVCVPLSVARRIGLDDVVLADD